MPVSPRSSYLAHVETTMETDWPEEITHNERIALTSKGDLKRTLKSYFNRDIEVLRIWETPTSGSGHTASPTTPYEQARRIHLVCESNVVCVCISTLRITSPDAAHLIADDHMTVGQVFRTLARREGAHAEFDLLEVGLEEVENGKESLWRRYILRAEGFECDIREIFPDRAMFVDGESWLHSQTPADGEQATTPRPIAIQLAF
ncbi:branched-chain alpha-keto acid dehydrogenase E1-alpha subunit [Ceratobasidium sp. AG-Ba]|nr:branched-chain alpha-keto acid dehydrogenase E1-alpha subunit [Ceratobasidium sp. AG-Ba]QRW09252.1 branched-chain alpha-keto acid dehydrogenase E1-alpha subunit [Ceratobasidium sp. AG-Ba]